MKCSAGHGESKSGIVDQFGLTPTPKNKKNRFQCYFLRSGLFCSPWEVQCRCWGKGCTPLCQKILPKCRIRNKLLVPIDSPKNTVSPVSWCPPGHQLTGETVTDFSCNDYLEHPSRELSFWAGIRDSPMIKP